MANEENAPAWLAGKDAVVRCVDFLRDFQFGSNFLRACAGHGPAVVGISERAAELADVFRGLRGASLQRAGSNQRRERAFAGAQVGVSNHGGREVRNHAAGR